MAAEGLIDTGAILAFLDHDDRWHQRCGDALSSLRLPLATSAAVLTELFHLVHDQPLQTSMAWTFIRSAAVRVLALGDTDLAGVDELMRRYADRPLDDRPRRFRDLPDPGPAPLSHRARALNPTEGPAPGPG